MFLKTVFSCLLFLLVSVSLFFVSLSCDDSGNNPSTVTDPVEWVGRFKVLPSGEGWTICVM